jgi:2-oxo-4-hydroxy-4-carboxy--5-ureidoimidazoline (OHCU) decarboxylase
VRHLPRQLTANELGVLFEGQTRFVVRLARHENPLVAAREVLREISEEELVEALNAHPRIGERSASARSAREQGAEEDPLVLRELARLNRAYEEKFGFRFIVFVNRRSRSEILKVLQQRLSRTRQEELDAAIADLVRIAEDRYRNGALKK